MIAQFQLSLMLLVPSSLIATDIRTGFPNLVSNERIIIDQFVLMQFEDYNKNADSQKLRPLLYADNFLQIIEDDLFNYYQTHDEIELVSCNLNLFTDVRANSAIKLFHRIPKIQLEIISKKKTPIKEFSLHSMIMLKHQRLLC